MSWVLKNNHQQLKCWNESWKLQHWTSAAEFGWQALPSNNCYHKSRGTNSSTNTAPSPISHCRPALWACSQITRQEGSFYCTSPPGCKRSEPAAGNRSRLHWQKDHEQPALASWKTEKDPTNTTPALPKVPNSGQQGCFGACLVCKYSTCCSRLSQLPCAALSRSPAGLYAPSCCVPHWTKASAKLITREWIFSTVKNLGRSPCSWQWWRAQLWFSCQWTAGHPSNWN